MIPHSSSWFQRNSLNYCSNVSSAATSLPSTLIIGIPFKLSLYVPLQNWFLQVSSNSERRTKMRVFMTFLSMLLVQYVYALHYSSQQRRGRHSSRSEGVQFQFFRERKAEFCTKVISNPSRRARILSRCKAAYTPAKPSPRITMRMSPRAISRQHPARFFPYQVLHNKQ